MERQILLCSVKAVVMDYIGTLVNAGDYTLEASRAKLHQALVEAGFQTSIDAFHEEYSKAHEKYRALRYEKFVEVTNAVWVCETLNNLGFQTNAEDPRLKVALNVFFQDYVESLALRPYAKRMLTKAFGSVKLGLVSNFTYAPVIHWSIKNLGIGKFFNTILTSNEVGWRKPHRRIFDDVLGRLRVSPAEAIFVGDSPLEDIKGAHDAGMRTIFVSSQFYTRKDLEESGQKPDYVAEDLRQVYKLLAQVVPIG
jgi:putative hydrolase of the HAD superfamily